MEKPKAKLVGENGKVFNLMTLDEKFKASMEEDKIRNLAKSDVPVSDRASEIWDDEYGDKFTRVKIIGIINMLKTGESAENVIDMLECLKSSFEWNKKGE